jgi:hypothetical protein
MKRRRSSRKRVQALPAGGWTVSELKFLLKPSGSFCGDVEAKNSGGSCGSLLFAPSSSTAADVVVVVKFGVHVEELYVVERKSVIRFVNNRSEMKSNLVVRVFGLELVLEPML